MKEYNKNGIKFEYKGYLDEDDFEKIIKIYLKVYENGEEDLIDEIPGMHFNPVLAEFMVNRTIGELCIKDFNEELHNKLFENGIYNFLKEDIVNLDYAFNIINRELNKIDSIGEIMKNFLDKIITMIPDKKEVDSLMKKWKKAENGYQKIVKGAKDEV